MRISAPAFRLLKEIINIVLENTAESRHHMHQCLKAKAWTEVRYREKRKAVAVTENAENKRKLLIGPGEMRSMEYMPMIKE